MVSEDIIVIGGGLAGYSAAMRARQLGMQVSLVEGDQFGGISVNWGAVPARTLLRSAEVLSLFKRAGEFGLIVKGVNFDSKKMFDRSRRAASQIGASIKKLLKDNDIEIIEGVAKFAGKGRIAILRDGKAEREISAKHIIIATGARQFVIPGFEPDGKFIWSYRDALRPNHIPKSLLIIGAGPAGMEFASFYSTLGVDVTVVEAKGIILPQEDEEISTLLRKLMEKRGVNFILGATAKRVDKNGKNITVTIEQGVRATLTTHECVLVAAGVVNNIDELGLENTNIRIEDGFIQASPWYITDEAGVYAIGDVVGTNRSAHKAICEGITCVERIAGVMGTHPVDYKNIPRCIYTFPNVASVGMTEAQAKEAGCEVRIGRSYLSNNGKAVAFGDTEGMIKAVMDARTGALLGAHILAADATEIIQGCMIARTLETTERELMRLAFPHATTSEAICEAVKDAYGKNTAA